MKQTLKPVSSKSNKDIILEIADANELTIDKNVKNKSGENDTEFEQIDLAFKQKNIEISELRDNIINFKEAVALRNKEIKQPLKLNLELSREMRQNYKISNPVDSEGFHAKIA